MHNPAQFLDDLKGAAVLADGFVRQGGYVCNHDAWLAGWLKQLPAEQLLTLDGYAAHIAQHCKAEIDRRNAE